MNFKKQITVLCSALALAVIPLSQAQAKTYRIVYAGFYGPTHPSTLAMEKYYCGNCGLKIGKKGRCPHCGAINE